MTVNVSIDLSGIERKLGGGNIRTAQRVLTERVMSDCTPFVPMDTGDLRGSAFMSSDDTIAYPERYAGYVYGHDRNWRIQGTTGHWLDAAEAEHLGEWENAVAGALGL
ncbi:MAG: minor capsid protein [Planifilum sp.]|jgi:hypothetical protein